MIDYANKKNDDFDWEMYFVEYGNQIEAEKNHKHIIEKDQYHFDGITLKNSQRFGVHPNWRLLYETILQLNPASVLECGCGFGDSVANIKMLKPDVHIVGKDIGEGQLYKARKRHPEIDTYQLQDLTATIPHDHESYELVYTQAVLMHMNTNGNWKDAMLNVFKYSTKYVLMMENWTKHSFLDDAIETVKKIPAWKDAKFYFRRSSEYNDKPHLMVVSKVPLDYEPLTDYDTLLGTVTQTMTEYKTEI